MFSPDFYPTPSSVIDQMLEGENIAGKVVLEPSAGKGDIVDRLLSVGAQVIACEKDPDLCKIVQTKTQLIGGDCLALTSEQVSHVEYIVMNPPFSVGAEHVLHMWTIAPAGCKIIALLNAETVKNTYSLRRKELLTAIEAYGFWDDIGDCFADAQRQTGVRVALIKFNKPGGQTNSTEFDGFFTDDEPEAQANGLISYNAIRDLVNRYVCAVKTFDEQLETAVRLNELTDIFSIRSSRDDAPICITISRGQVPVTRTQYKKDLQKAGWNWVFSKMNLQKYATKGLKEDINKFVETQENVPFTMRNIYKMLDIVIGTTSQRMDKAVLEVFDNFTAHHHDNRRGIEGWQTNSHYLLNRRFIVNSSTNFDDLNKALCYLTGTDYDDLIDWGQFERYQYKLKDKDGKYVSQYEERKDIKVCCHDYDLPSLEARRDKMQGATIEAHPWSQLWGKWVDWGFFRIKRYMKGSFHLEFVDEKVWAAFNARVAKLKGYPLHEKKEQTKWQQQRQDKADGVKKAPAQRTAGKVISTFQL